jgi:hypothetical protein
VDRTGHAAHWGVGPFVLGALERPEHVRITAHVSACPICRREVEDLARVAALLTLLTGPGRTHRTADDERGDDERGDDERGDDEGGGDQGGGDQCGGDQCGGRYPPRSQ